MELVKLKKVVDVITGFPFASELYTNSGVRVVRGENITEGRLRWDTIKCWDLPFDKKEFYSLKEDDVVIGMDGSKVGKNKARIKKEDLPLILAQRVACLRAKKSLDQVYLFYCINNVRFEDFVFRIQTGSSIPHISKSQIEDFSIPFPDLPTQKSIAKVLSDLDTKIELNNKINRELESMAKTLYDYWFVQFDFPDANGKPYKSSGGKMVYNAELKREIPEGWEVKTLLDIATYTNGLACQKFRPTNEDFLPVIKIREMRDGINENTERVRADIPEKLKVFNGDVLFSWSASLEVIIWTGGKGGLNQHIFKVTSKKYPRSFYYFQLIWYLQHFKIIAELRKTTMGHITQDHLKQSRIVVPPIDIVKNLDKQLKPVQEKQILINRQNQHLTALRDWLLPMLMNGQVTVKEAEEKLSMAAEPSVKYGN